MKNWNVSGDHLFEDSGICVVCETEFQYLRYRVHQQVCSPECFAVRRLAGAKRRSAPRVALYLELKSKACMDCHGAFPPECMQFDHRPGEEKLFEIGIGYRSGPWEQVIAEIAKCDLICANCHAIRTTKRKRTAWNTH